MPFAIETRSVDMNSRTATFDFGQAVYQYIVGVAFVKLAYAKAHQVEVLSLHLTSNLEGGVVSVKVTPMLRDHAKHSYDPEQSCVRLTCLAVVGDNDLKASLAPVSGIANDGASGPLDISPNSDLCLGVLSGFDYDYGGADHTVRTIAASVDAR